MFSFEVRIIATLKALDKSILAAIDERNLQPEIEESEEFRARIQGALVKLQKCENCHGQQKSPKEVKMGLFHLVLVSERSYKSCT